LLGLEEPATGTVYFGRAVLTLGTLWPVLAFATEHPRLPDDSTSDQWFNHAQFDAYHLLGRHVGRAVIDAERVNHPVSASGGPGPVDQAPPTPSPRISSP